MKAQNGNYIILDPAVDACPPFFISTVNPSTPVRRRIQCEFTNSNVFNLPEVREYGRRQQAQSRDRWDAMLVPQWDDAYMRIPEGAWFPVQLDDGRNEAAGVYSIVEWMPNDHAILDIVCCDRMVEIQPGCQLRRRLRQAIGEMVSLDIGIVRKVAD